MTTLQDKPNDYLEGLGFELSRTELYDKIRKLEKRVKAKMNMLYQVRIGAKKANQTKRSIAKLLLSLRDEGKLKMTDIEIADRCFVSIKTVTNQKGIMKRLGVKDA